MLEELQIDTIKKAKEAKVILEKCKKEIAEESQFKAELLEIEELLNNNTYIDVSKALKQLTEIKKYEIEWVCTCWDTMYFKKDSFKANLYDCIIIEKKVLNKYKILIEEAKEQTKRTRQKEIEERNLIRSKRNKQIYEEVWYNSKVKVVLMLIFFFPLGIYGLWKNPFFSDKTKWIVTCVYILYILVIMSRMASYS